MMAGSELNTDESGAGVLGALEQGLEESWYEKKMRRMYGAG